MMEQKPKILIIDDDLELCRVIGLMLHRGGYEVHSALSGIEGLAKVEELKPDLIIVDVMMPLIDGLEVCRRLRAKPATRHLPIIILSALEQVDDKLKGFQAGADDYVPKPVDARELLARVRVLLQRSAYARPAVARTTSFVGAKGGVGTTSLAANIAVALAKAGKSVILAELRHDGGTLRYQLKIQSEQHLGAILALDPAQVKRPEIERRIIPHSTGLRLVLAPPGDGNDPPTAGHVDLIFDVLSQRADYLLFDLGTSLVTPGVRRALELSDQILLVTEPEPLSVACGKNQLQKMKEWSVNERLDVVIVSRTPSNSSLNRVEVENRLGLGTGEAHAAARWETRSLEVDVRLRQGVAAVVPCAPELFHDAVRSGVPIILAEPGSAAGRALADLTQWLAEEKLPQRIGAIPQ
jgi:DNA-binding response OmpR family regulator